MPNTYSNYDEYIRALRNPFRKLCRLRFLNPDGSVAFALDSRTKNDLNSCFLADGNITCNLQNGQRRTASVTLANVDEQFGYNVNNMWFGQEIALDEGLVLPDGSEFYIQQGIFLLATPTEDISPTQNTITYNLVDKWANLDGTLSGNLEGTYVVANGTNIFTPITTLLSEDKGNGYPVDNTSPVYTLYYNGKTQTLPDGTTAPLVNCPYEMTTDRTGTKADVILGLVSVVNGWVGYDSSGALRVDASQDDIDDSTKPVLWTFGTDESTLLGLSYSISNTDVYNDVIVVGDQLDDYTQPSARAENYDPKSDTNINIIGRKTITFESNGYATDTQCSDLAAWKLKRTSVLQKTVTISCSQILHVTENSLVEIIRTDKAGSPIERHLVQGFSRPLTSGGEMTINATSVNDYPEITNS